MSAVREPFSAFCSVRGEKLSGNLAEEMEERSDLHFVFARGAFDELEWGEWVGR